MVGKMLKALEDEGIADGTFAMLTGDNGGVLNRGGQTVVESGYNARVNCPAFNSMLGKEAPSTFYCSVGGNNSCRNPFL